jgi:hypothetical protein
LQCGIEERTRPDQSGGMPPSPEAGRGVWPFTQAMMAVVAAKLIFDGAGEF